MSINMTMKKYWPIDENTNEVLQEKAAESRGGMFHIPVSALKIAPIESVAGFAVIAVFNENGEAIGSELMEDSRDKNIYKKSDCSISKKVDQLGPIDDKWTLLVPLTTFDEWNDGWKTNVSRQYQSELEAVSDVRRSLYTSRVDPLRAEAAMIRLYEKDELKAAEYEQQAVAIYQKIRDEHPWPTLI